MAPPSALHLTTPHQTILPLPTHLPPACAARAAQDTAACGTKSERPEADGLSGPGSEGEAPGGTGGSATQGGRGGGWAGSGRGVRPLEGKRQRSASTSSVPPGQTASETRAPGPAHGGTAARAQSGDANESERSRSGHGQGDSSISGHSADRAEAHPDANVTVSLADSMAELEVSTRSSVPGIAGATAHTRARLSLGWEVAAAAPDPSGDAAAAAQREEFSFPTQRDTISGNSSLSASLARAGDAPPESSCAAGGYLALEGTSRRGGYVSVGCLVQEEGGATALLTLRCAAGTARRVCQTPVWEPAPRSPGGEPGARRSGSFVQSGAASQGAAAVGELRRSGSIGKGTRGGLGQRTASSLDMGAAHGGTGLAPGERPEKWEMMVLDGVFAVHGRTKGRCCVVVSALGGTPDSLGACLIATGNDGRRGVV